MLPSSEKVHVQQSTVDSFLFYTCTMYAFVGGYMQVSTHALRGGRAERGVRFFEAEAATHQCWEPNSVTLKMQEGLLTSASSLQAQ